MAAASAQAQTQLAPITYVEVEGVRRDAREASPAVTVIDRESIKRQGVVTLADLLRTQAGLDIVRSGGSGQASSLFIRGADSKHTLVLIDGMEANDSTTPTRGFDFSSLSSENIERIEVYRGSQSVRFGSDAVGGVVNIITRKGEGPLRLSYYGEAGEYSTIKGAGTASGSKGSFNYSAGIASSRNDGPSSAASSLGNGEHDASRRLSTSARFGWSLSPKSSADFTLRHLDNFSELDSSGGSGGDDPNYDSSMRQLLAGGSFRRLWLNDRMDSRLFAGHSITERGYDNRRDPIHTDDYHESFDSKGTKLETRHIYELEKDGNLEFAVQMRSESSDSQGSFNGSPTQQSRHRQTIWGESISYDFDRDDYLLELGFRHDEPNGEDSILNYSIQPGYHLSDWATTLRASYNTGFKTPSLFQRYSTYGDPQLQTEHSAVWDVSAEFRFASATKLSVSYFKNQYKNLIDFQTSKYKNVGAAVSRGVEVQAETLLSREWELRPSYTFLETRDLATGLSLLRRPKNRLTIETVWRPQPFEFALDWTGVGTREDLDPAGNRIRMPFYDVVTMRAKYYWRRDLTLGARVENLFNRSYEETSGYGSSRMAGYLNVSGDF